MERYDDQGVLFSKKFFTKEMIARLSRPSPIGAAAVSLRSIPMAAPIPLSEPTEEAAFASAWAEMSKDPEFLKAVKKKGYSEKQGLAEFKKALSKRVTGVDNRTARMLKIKYRVSTQRGRIVHTMGSDRILSIPQTHAQAQLISSNAEKAIAVAFVVIDLFSIVAAAAGIIVTINKRPLAAIMESELGPLLREVNSPMAQEWQRLITRGEIAKGISKVLATLRGTTNFKTLIEKFFSSLAWYQVAIAALQLLAAIILLIASFGASLAAQIAALVGSVAVLVADVVALVAALAT